MPVRVLSHRFSKILTFTNYVHSLLIVDPLLLDVKTSGSVQLDLAGPFEVGLDEAVAAARRVVPEPGHLRRASRSPPALHRSTERREGGRRAGLRAPSEACRRHM